MAPSDAGTDAAPRVAIVGRGPVGMTLALRLAGFGIRSILIDFLGEQIDPGSKAVVMHQHAVEVLSSVGVGEQMLREGVAWTIGRTYRRNQQLFELRMGVRAGELPRVLNIPQARTEELLLRRVLDTPQIETRLHHRLVGLEQDESGCRLTLEGPDGPVTVSAPYVAGCDGSRSTTRKLCGIAFTGYAHDDVFLINDIVARLPFPNERRFYFDPPFNPGRTVLIHPQGPDQWHIDFQVGAHDGAPEPPERTRERLARVIGDVDFTVTWSTTYRFKQLVAQRFRVGRVFLVGDAAHLTSPYGARGLNSGLADADNLAWKLAEVLTGRADPALLDTYEQERRPAALENLRITGATARFMSPLTRRQRWRRDLILAVAAKVPSARRFVDSGRFYEPARYESGPAGGDALVDALGVGTLVPDVALCPGPGQPARLAAALWSQTSTLLIPGVGDDLAAVRARADEIAATGRRCLVLVPPAAAGNLASAGNPAGDGIPAGGTAAVLRLPEDATWWPGRPLGRGLALLVRPDRYVQARTEVSDTSAWPDLRGWVEAQERRLRETVQ